MVAVSVWSTLTGLWSAVGSVLSLLYSVFMSDPPMFSSILGLTLLLYIFHCKIRPYVPCWWCAGKKRIYGWFGAYSHYSCWWCAGTERRRYAARFFGWY